MQQSLKDLRKTQVAERARVFGRLTRLGGLIQWDLEEYHEEGLCDEFEDAINDGEENMAHYLEYR